MSEPSARKAMECAVPAEMATTSFGVPVGAMVSCTAVAVVSAVDADVWGDERRSELVPHAYTVPPAPPAPMSTYNENQVPAAIRGFVNPDAMRVGWVTSVVRL